MSWFRPANGKPVQWRGGKLDELVLAQVPKVVVETVFHGVLVFLEVKTLVVVSAEVAFGVAVGLSYHGSRIGFAAAATV